MSLFTIAATLYFCIASALQYHNILYIGQVETAIHSEETSTEAIRRESLPLLPKLGISLGPSTPLPQDIDIFQLFDGLCINDGIFFFTTNKYIGPFQSNLCYANKEGCVLFSVYAQIKESILQARADVIIFEPTPLNFKEVPQAYSDKTPNNRSWILKKEDDIIALTFDNISFSPDPSSNNIKALNDNSNVLNELLHQLTNPKKLVYNKEEASELRMIHQQKQRNKSKTASKKMERDWKQHQEQQTKLSPKYGFPVYTKGRFKKWLETIQPGKNFNDFDTYYASLKLPECSTKLILPNIHQGTITPNWFKKIWSGKMDILSQNINGVVVSLLHSKKGSWENKEIIVMVGCTHSRALAMRTLHQMVLLPFDPDIPGQTFDMAADKITCNPFNIGDYSLGHKPVIGNFGGVVTGSEKSAVYFLRGNTVVMVASMDPTVSVLTLARKIDAALQAREQQIKK